MGSVVHGVTKSQTWLSNFHFHFTFHTEKAIDKVSETRKSIYLNKEDVLYIHDGILLSHKKLNVAICNMNLGIIILSEVNKRNTNTIWYQLYAEFFKKGYKLIYLQNKLADIENTFMVTTGEKEGQKR